jgi:hypothetical protein
VPDKQPRGTVEVVARFNAGPLGGALEARRSINVGVASQK